jgi:integrase
MPIRKDAEGRWHVETCVRRRRIHRKLPAGATASDAKRVEAELIRALHAQAAPVIPGDPPLTELLADYAERHTKTLRSPDTARYHALRIARWVEGRRASEARAVAAKIKDEMRDHYAAGTINRSLGALRKALSIAWQAGRTPVDYSGLVQVLPDNKHGTTVLDLRQVQALADRSSEAVRAAIWIAIFTGCRRGEILAMNKSMIGRDEITLPAGATKTLRTRTVPIIAPLRPWLKHVPLGINFEGLKSGFRRAREAAGMPEVTFRDLRRSCGTLMIQRQVPLHVVSKILGHSSTGVTERVYAHLAPKQLKEGLNVLSDLHTHLHRKPRRAKA